MGIRYEQVRYLASYGTVEQLPQSKAPEVSFVGRSNVGKSSLINKLFNRKSLAKVSGKPGKTANINFFEADGIHFVDLPGYGFAQRSQAEKQRWADLIDAYFTSERSHNLVIALVDIRLDAQALDLQMIDYLKGAGLPFIIALTKADKLSRQKQQAQLRKLAAAFDVDEMACVITSAQTGLGIDTLKRFIEQAC
ncbi:MAG: YihA family ribosome biogenesis GTP-binding protein [Coriobacteriaceae bacterium]|jgi:GTP-binding protein|nr:ribosome biogenesis GTP-binding protein YihA/YsxC [Atopobium sp.]MCH4081629.1 ribosome biogenesis GTP-binding protein YihA/YsxC [Atopobiaceae bacterium]MCI1345315.1 ribosome biogenesis GTP-binding protein YihA/YsxC [Atopobiaceae bacterium]MCI1498938.1 ribosome biogenesis GTP-binding protein YihA/YsxC [Atopobiaceae bacterium]RRF92160.1 MAG: YihA family ribosome biogenesis GTP-binding protein [Coriobacteriaceae bacterium]